MAASKTRAGSANSNLPSPVRKPVVGKWAVKYKPEPCCGDSQEIGIPFIVSSINYLSFATHRNCEKRIDSVMVVYSVAGVGSGGIYLSCVKRIPDPPPEEVDDVAELEAVMRMEVPRRRIAQAVKGGA